MMLIPLVAAASLAATALAPPRPNATPPGGTPPQKVAGSISDTDYPVLSVRLSQQGTTRTVISIDAHGAVSNCRVEASSGSDILDASTCALIRERFRYMPARDSSGHAVAVDLPQSVTWRLPKDSPAEIAALTPVFGAWELRVTGLRDEIGMRCAVEGTGFPPALSDASCPAAARVPQAELANDPKAIMVVTSLTPEGTTPQRQPVRGTLLGHMASDLEVRPDGSIGSCHDVAVSRSPLGPLPSLCSGANTPVPAFARDPQGRTRRGRLQVQFYRMGAPET